MHGQTNRNKKQTLFRTKQCWSQRYKVSAFFTCGGCYYPEGFDPVQMVMTVLHFYTPTFQTAILFAKLCLTSIKNRFRVYLKRDQILQANPAVF